jgi:hypothetical protein
MFEFHMKSYIKIYGPPILKAIQVLETVAVDLPEVCIMDSIFEQSSDIISDPEELNSYFQSLSVPITRERCGSIISKSGESVGEHDFYFEWFSEPSNSQLNSLIEQIDEALSALGCKYTISTK